MQLALIGLMGTLVAHMMGRVISQYNIPGNTPKEIMTYLVGDYPYSTFSLFLISDFLLTASKSKSKSTQLP